MIPLGSRAHVRFVALQGGDCRNIKTLIERRYIEEKEFGHPVGARLTNESTDEAGGGRSLHRDQVVVITEGRFAATLAPVIAIARVLYSTYARQPVSSPWISSRDGTRHPTARRMAIHNGISAGGTQESHDRPNW